MELTKEETLHILVSRNRILELQHIQLELKAGRSLHIRHFVDSWFCYKNNYVTRNGGQAHGRITFSEWVSPAAIGLSNNEIVQKEHIVPLCVITAELCKLPTTCTLDDIEDKLLILVNFATITKEEDALLKEADLNEKMPPEFYDRESNLYGDPFARYKKVGITITKTI